MSESVMKLVLLFVNFDSNYLTHGKIIEPGCNQ